MTEHFEGIVIYTDGSARPTNPGKTGWAVHGYRYTTEVAKQGTGLSKYLITDRGYINESDKHLLNPTTSNKEVVPPQFALVTPLQYYDFFGNDLAVGTNNAAEVDALYYALDKFRDVPVKKIQIYTDSEYLRRGVTEWMDAWEKRRWVKPDGSPVKNAMNWKRLKDVLLETEGRGVEVVIEWVKGHASNFGNIKADLLATVAVLYSMGEVNKNTGLVSEAKGYWKREVPKHPFFSFKHLYFNSTEVHNVLGRYYIADPSGDEMVLGRPLPDAAYSVVRLKEYDQAIETVRKNQFKAANEINTVMVMRLDKLFHKDVYPVVMEHGEYSMVSQNRRGSLGMNFADGMPLTVEINPPGLVLRAIQNFGMLEELLDMYENIRDGRPCEISRSKNLLVHDITDRIYDVVVKAKKNTTVTEHVLKPIFINGQNGTKFFKIGIDLAHEGKTKSVQIPILVGADLLARDNLKRLESHTPRVYLLTWREALHSVRYATVIDCDSGCGIWSNFFADRVFLQDCV